MYHQPNHSHRPHDYEPRVREGSSGAYLIGIVAAAAVAFGAFILVTSPDEQADPSAAWDEPAEYVFSMNAYCDQPIHGRFIVTVVKGEVTEAVAVESSAETFLQTNGMGAVPTLGEILASAEDGADITFDDAGVPSQVRTTVDGGGDACFDILAFSIPLPDDALRSIYSHAIAQTCAEAQPHGGCSGRLEVSEQWDAGFGTSRMPMPAVVRETIESELPNAAFTDADNRPEGTMRLLIGPYEIIRDGVVRVEAGYVCGGLCGSGRAWYFQLTDGVWQPVSAGSVREPDSRWEA